MDRIVIREWFAERAEPPSRLKPARSSVFSEGFEQVNGTDQGVVDVQPIEELIVGPDGRVRSVAADGTPSRELTPLTEETFAAADLPAIAKQLRDAQEGASWQLADAEELPDRMRLAPCIVFPGERRYHEDGPDLKVMDTASTEELAVGPDGRVRSVQSDGAPSRELVALTQETFAAPNLDAIAKQIRESQASGRSVPADPAKQLWVDRSGDIVMGAPDDRSRVSELTQETFAATPADRLATEQWVVANRMPPGTHRVSDGTYTGWAYEIRNEFGDTYTLFLYHDPAVDLYRVSLVSPRMEGTVDGHGCHLYADGTLCLNTGISGYKSMEQAYARSALWTRGASFYTRGYGFQFNLGQGV